MPIIRLQQRVKKTLQDNSFDILNDHITAKRFTLVSSFGKDLEESTFYVDKKSDLEGLIIGANITFDNEIITKSLSNKIQGTALKYNISCSPVKYDKKDETGTISLQVVYNFSRYNEKNFLLYLNNFKDCIKSLYADISLYLQHQDALYLDLSMFACADWDTFDPYIYIEERDKRYNGSWEKYAHALRKKLSKKENLIDLICVEMCQEFEEKNNGIPMDLSCDYIMETINDYINDDEKTFN